MVDETPAAAAAAPAEVDYTINNADTITKYKDAATIAHRVLAEIAKAAQPGKTILELCELGDKRLEEETAKVYAKKKGLAKGIAFPTTISPNDILTPYTPIPSEAVEAKLEIASGDVLKIQLGAHIDGFPAIVSDTIAVGTATADQADLILGTHYATEALLRLIMPPEVHPSHTTEKPYKQPSAASITSTLQKIAASYGCNLVESTTSYQMERNEIESKKRLVLAPGENVPKSEGTPEVGDVWGIEMSLSKGAGKVKEVPNRRPTLFRKTETKFLLKRDTSRKTLSEISKKFQTFPFGLRQLDDERAAKMGVIECVRNNVLRQFEVLGDKDGAICSRVFVTAAITKNGIVKLCAPPDPTVTSEKKIEDEEIQKILDISLKQDAKKKKKAAAKKEAAAA